MKPLSKKQQQTRHFSVSTVGATDLNQLIEHMNSHGRSFDTHLVAAAGKKGHSTCKRILQGRKHSRFSNLSDKIGLLQLVEAKQEAGSFYPAVPLTVIPGSFFETTDEAFQQKVLADVILESNENYFRCSTLFFLLEPEHSHQTERLIESIGRLFEKTEKPCRWLREIKIGILRPEKS